MLTTNEAIELVKRGYINGSVYQCTTLKEYLDIKSKLICIGWKKVHENGALTSFIFEKDGTNYWYTLIL